MSTIDKDAGPETIILECIREIPYGSTITDISKKTGYSRNTVSKYVSILAIKKKIFGRKIGAFQLYFSTEKNFFTKMFAISYYKAFLKGLKKYYPTDYDIFKKIGKDCFEYIDFSFDRAIAKELKGLRANRFILLFYDVFGKLYPNIDIVDPVIETYSKEDDEGRKIILRFKSREYLFDTDDYVYHFYMIAGIAEAIYKRDFEKDVRCDIETVHLSDNPEESYIELVIKLDQKS